MSFDQVAPLRVDRRGQRRHVQLSIRHGDEAFAVPQQRNRLQQELVYSSGLKAAVAPASNRLQVRGNGRLYLLAAL
jgi:hypothetical protein